MFTEFHGVSENPFPIVPSPNLAWLGAGMRKIRAELCQAVLAGRGLILLSGGPGLGKSLALTLLASDLKQGRMPCRIHFLNADAQLRAAELVRRVALDAAANDDDSATDQLTVLLVDDAQRLSSKELATFLLETARRSNRMRLVLAGTPELDRRVNEALTEYPVMVANRWSLEGLRSDEISSFVAGHLQAAESEQQEIFTAGAIEYLVRHSEGVPRQLNALCSTALFLARREGRGCVDVSHIEEASHLVNSGKSLPDTAEPQPLSSTSMSAHRPPIKAADSTEIQSAPAAGLEPTVLKALAARSIFDDSRTDVVGRVATGRGYSESSALETRPRESAASGAEVPMLEASERTFDKTVAPALIWRQIAQLESETEEVARQRPPILMRTGTQRWRRLTLCASVAGAVVLLVVAFGWHTQDEEQSVHAVASAIELSVQPTDSPSKSATNQPIVTSPNLGPAESGEDFRVHGMLPANSSMQQNDRQEASAAGGRPRETIGPEELASLLARARQQIEDFALTTPPSDNAFETLQSVLAAMPEQPDALQSIHDIAGRYAVLATQAERRGEYGLAERYVNKGLKVVPNDRDLLAIQLELATHSTSQIGLRQPSHVEWPVASTIPRGMPPGTSK